MSMLMYVACSGLLSIPERDPSLWLPFRSLPFHLKNVFIVFESLRAEGVTNVVCLKPSELNNICVFGL